MQIPSGFDHKTNVRVISSGIGSPMSGLIADMDSYQDLVAEKCNRYNGAWRIPNKHLTNFIGNSAASIMDNKDPGSGTTLRLNLASGYLVAGYMSRE